MTLFLIDFQYQDGHLSWVYSWIDLQCIMRSEKLLNNDNNDYKHDYGVNNDYDDNDDTVLMLTTWVA